MANIIGFDNSDDTLVGTNKRDIILGLGGDDILLGRDGRDALFGGDGDDVLTGDNDNFYNSVDHADDTILDFRRSEDEIELENAFVSLDGPNNDLNELAASGPGSDRRLDTVMICLAVPPASLP